MRSDCSEAWADLLVQIGGNIMSTEKSLKRLIFLYAGKIKRLRGELEGTIARKKEQEVQLRELRWKAKEKKTAKPYPIEKIVAKVLRKATKKNV